MSSKRISSCFTSFSLVISTHFFVVKTWNFCRNENEGKAFEEEHYENIFNLRFFFLLSFPLLIEISALTHTQKVRSIFNREAITEYNEIEFTILSNYFSFYWSLPALIYMKCREFCFIPQLSASHFVYNSIIYWFLAWTRLFWHTCMQKIEECLGLWVFELALWIQFESLWSNVLKTFISFLISKLMFVLRIYFINF